MPKTDLAIKGELVVSDAVTESQLAIGGALPTMIEAGESPAVNVWHGFFEGEISNRYTKRDYEKHIRRFLAWAAGRGRGSLAEITAADVGRYIKGLAAAGKSILDQLIPVGTARWTANRCHGPIWTTMVTSSLSFKRANTKTISKTIRPLTKATGTRTVTLTLLT